MIVIQLPYVMCANGGVGNSFAGHAIGWLVVLGLTAL